jgi:DNA-binding response OmpR family regulator
MNDDDIRPGGALGVEQPQSRTRRPHRILVVDDESAMRMLMTVVLADCGYHVDTAEDGAVAWEALQANRYDLLITDQDMPKISGVQLVKNLRSSRMALPVVMVTASLPTNELAQNPSLVLAATILKPFALSELLSTVTNALQVASY